jgi:ABC-type hemin transport system substrate-binding protein
MRSPWTILASLACCVLVAACSRTQPTPPAPSPTPRIVSLSPALSVILRDLGHEQSIVARHSYDFVLPSAVPVAGDQAGIDYESLVRAKPTHVFTQWGSRALPERLAAMAREQRWVLRDVPILNMDDISAAVATLDRAVRSVDDTAPLSPAAVQLQAQLAALLHPAQKPDRSRVGKVLILISTAPPTALGPGSAHDELLRALGATPALTDGKSYMELTHEDLVRLAPDAMILFIQRATDEHPHAGSESGATPTDDPWKPLRPLDLPALRTNRVAVIDDPLALLPSTGLIPVGEKLRTLLDKWNTR